MKVKELMIGDWVLADYKYGKQVYAKIGFLISFHNVMNHDEIGFVPVPQIGELVQYINDERTIHPIPLTEEILMENGFSKNTKFDGIEYYKDGLVLEGNFIRIGRREIRLNYVHELQHLLRICGLNELADNFKIKP